MSTSAPESPAKARSSDVAARRGRRAADRLGESLVAWSEHAPVALALVDAQGKVHWVNPAFERLTGFASRDAVGSRVQALLDGPLAPPWSLQDPPERRALHARDGHAIACEVHAAPAGEDRWIVTLVDRGEADALQAELTRQRELLDFVQDSARIGLWERDIASGRGRWDPHMFRFWGVEPESGTPSRDEASQATIPQDRLLDTLVASQGLPGRHVHRFRLMGDDGQVRRVRAHWDVRTAPDGTPDHMVGLVMDDTETYTLASAIDMAQVQLQLAADVTDLALWRHDFRSGRLYFSDRAYQMLGLTPKPEGLTLEDTRELIHPDDHAEAEATFRRALESGRVEDMQLRYRHSDGGWRHLLSRRVVQRDGHGRPVSFLGVALDVTGQVERLQRATELARQLEDVAAASGIGIWRVSSDGQRTEWNAQMYAMFGWPLHEPAPTLAQVVEHCVHPDDRERVRDVAGNWLKTDAPPRELAHRILLPDGRVRHVVVRGRYEPPGGAYRVSGVSIDVTERENALQALRDATERSALVTRAAGLGLWEWDSSTGVSRWDEQMYRMRGLPPRTGPAPSFDEMASFVHPEDREHVQAMLDKAIGADDFLNYEFRIVRPDGAVRRIASRSKTVRDDQGRLLMRLGVNWDVTEMREAEAVQQQHALALRESQAKSELLARMSHELRTPMNAILGFTQLLLADDMEDVRSTRHQRLEHIRGAGEHLLTLIDNVLELSRLDGADDTLSLQAVRLGPLILETLPLVERQADEQDVTVTAQPTPLLVRADPTRLKQVLVNLLTNAIKYNRRGGHVRIEAQVEPAGPGDTGPGHVLLRVSDTGMGLTAAQAAQVFEPFNRAGAERQEIEGTGIGLTIVKALVARMHGSVQLRSTPGEGSVFEVRLEAAGPSSSPASAAVVPPPPVPAPGERARRVLYIEDNPVNVMIVHELVRRRGDLEFESKDDGVSGVACAQAAPPGLVLVDMQLPDIEGGEVLRRLRAHPSTASLPCIALSANAIPEDIERALKAGFDAYWTKPLDFRQFQEALDRVFGPVAAR